MGDDAEMTIPTPFGELKLKGKRVDPGSACMPKKGDWVAWKYMGDWHAALYDPEWMKSWESHDITHWVILEPAASGDEINEQI